jgi:hypothetical protein
MPPRPRGDSTPGGRKVSCWSGRARRVWVPDSGVGKCNSPAWVGPLTWIGSRCSRLVICSARRERHSTRRRRLPAEDRTEQRAIIRGMSTRAGSLASAICARLPLQNTARVRRLESLGDHTLGDRESSLAFGRQAASSATSCRRRYALRHSRDPPRRLPALEL